MKLRIIEGSGWSKTIQLEKAISRVGCAAFNDVQIVSPDVAPVHLQIFNAIDLPTGCRVVNLAERLRACVHGVDTLFEPYATLDIHDGDEIFIADHCLTFHLPLSTGLVRRSPSIEASLSFLNAVLHPEAPLEGRLLLKNVGRSNACQFRVSVRGLPEDCYLVDPIPLLYSSAQEEVRLLFFHHGTYPEAGMHDLLVTISAPESYPGEELVIRQALYVSPVYGQELSLLDDLSRAAPLPAAPLPAAPLPAAPLPAGRSPAGQLPIAYPAQPAITSQADAAAVTGTRAMFDELAPLPVVEESPVEWLAQVRPDAALPAPEPAPQPAPPESLAPSATPAAPAERPLRKPRPAQDIARLKVVRDQPDDFWEEGQPR